MTATAIQWTSRKRVEAALHHREADRVPYDLGGTILTGIHHLAYRKLRAHLGLPDVEIGIEDPIQQLAVVHEDVKRIAGVDVWGINPRGARKRTVRMWSEDGYDKLIDEWGIEWGKPQDGGFYYDMQRHPLAGIESADDLKKFTFPDPLEPQRYAGIVERADELMNQREVAYVLGRNAPGVWEVALWTRGFENYFCDMIANRPLAEALLDLICEIKMKYWGRALELLGENVMVVSEADDLASQDRCLVSPQMYRDLIKPRHTRLFSFIKKQAKVPVKIFYHSCGAVMPLIPDLIEAGIDILNPVQVSAAGMDTKELKRQFGKDLTFWGGGVDTQQVLPRGTPQQVRDEVRRRIDDLAPGGGFVFTTVHNTQADVPPENIVAMWDALREFGIYG